MTRAKTSLMMSMIVALALLPQGITASNTANGGIELVFNSANGGQVYSSVIDAYEYFKENKIADFVPTSTSIQFGNNDIWECFASKTSCRDYGGDIHIWYDDIRLSDGGSTSATHEYSHKVSSDWSIPYGPKRSDLSKLRVPALCFYGGLHICTA